MYKHHNSKQTVAIKYQDEAKRCLKKMYIKTLIEYITKSEHGQTDQNIQKSDKISIPREVYKTERRKNYLQIYESWLKKKPLTLTLTQPLIRINTSQRK